MLCVNVPRSVACAVPAAPDRKKDGAAKAKVPTMEEMLWSKRFQISERSRAVHRANATTLVTENERLQGSLQVRLQLLKRVARRPRDRPNLCAGSVDSCVTGVANPVRQNRSCSRLV